MLHPVNSDAAQAAAEARQAFDNRCLLVGKLPNGDRLLLDPDDLFVYQVDPARQVVLSRFCSLELWKEQYAPLFALDNYSQAG